MIVYCIFKSETACSIEILVFCIGEDIVQSSLVKLIVSSWRWLTEPAASISDPEAKYRARTVASTLVLTLALVIVPMLERIGTSEPILPWILILIGVGIAYGFSRTRYYRQGALLAILTLWLLPTYTMLLIGSPNLISFVLSIGRLLLLSLLLTYVLFSLRTSIVLGLVMVVIFMVSPASLPGVTPSIQRAFDFFLTVMAIFAIFVITRQYDQSQRQEAEAAKQKQSEFAAALSTTAALLTSTLNLDEVLDRILDQAAIVSPLNSAEVLLIDSGVARIARTRGYYTDADRQAVISLRFDVQETRNLRMMVETGKPIIIADVRDYPDWVDVETAGWIRASVGAPIRLEGETIGFLNVTSSTPGIFTTQHAEWLQAFADQAAIAIRNARLYDEVRRYAGELEGLVKERTSELELERHRLRAILDGTGEGIFYTEDERIQFANVAFCALLGYTQEEIVGQNYLLFFGGEAQPEQQRVLDEAREAMRRQGVWRGEFKMRRKDGSLCDVGLTVSLIGASAASPFRAVTVVRDISREKLLQVQRSNFVAYASHELRTPITNMKTRLYLLRRRPEGLDEHLEILDDVTERMRHLVEDLLDISRLEHGLIPLRQQEVSLGEVIHAVITLQQPEAELKGLDLHCNLPDKPLYVSGDQERLNQVITNLLTNAINYTPSGGRVTISVARVDERAQIEVEDTGIGISPDNLPHIFQPFYRVVSDVEGTGLGLSIAKEIIEMHGGALAVRSEPKRGSTFTITLPLLKPMRAT